MLTHCSLSVCCSLQDKSNVLSSVKTFFFFFPLPISFLSYTPLLTFLFDFLLKLSSINCPSLQLGIILALLCTFAKKKTQKKHKSSLSEHVLTSFKNKIIDSS